MTKRWSSTRGDLTKTKREASKEARRISKDELDTTDEPMASIFDEWEIKHEK